MASDQTALQRGNDGTMDQPSSIRLSLILIGLCLAVFLTGMDQTILATATPIISNEFKALDDIAWWSNAYLLTLSSFQLFYGKLYSLFSIKLVYLTAIALFEVGSLICTTAPNSIALIIGRAIAGLGAAGVFSGGILITTKLIPLSRRAAYLGIMSGAFGLAAIVGPFLGGALTDRTTWRWCFGINLPLGAVTVVLCAVLVHLPKEPEIQSIGLVNKFKQLDIPGTICLVGSLICLLMALQWGGSSYPWNSSRVIALFVVFGILLIVFIVTQMTMITGNSRTIPASLLKNRDIWLAASYAMCMTGGVYVAILYLPVWFQAIRGSSALSSGAMLTPLIGGYVVCSIISGGVTSAIGYYNPGMIIGTALSIAGATLLTTIHMDSSIAKIVGYQLLYGFGVGFGFGQPSYVVQTILPPSDVPIGVTFITLMQNLSASIFVAVGQSILQGELRSRLQSILPDVNIQSLLNSGASDFASSLPPESRQQALSVYSVCLVSTLYISLALSCTSVVGAIGIRWYSMKKTHGQTIDDTSDQPGGIRDGATAGNNGEHVEISPTDGESFAEIK
ncbi:major facilitator superfamily domain-containing protein [Annulohypoxylon truncatum]|uniref:major facilitator superfamily domain-containing protein n=1 Tax=Annulohypoxylon truncatum TaxID=327061 RepID=UPI0020081C42|nr:major facilitator superfamily domain-containing protein [Annulohypoxylon truncatum]KAI1214200.1 major facilitator superfamily domain-containing protein [Annulohypoxylon truncatum]